MERVVVQWNVLRYLHAIRIFVSFYLTIHPFRSMFENWLDDKRSKRSSARETFERSAKTRLRYVKEMTRSKRAREMDVIIVTR